jgi:Protein of unknown function (DUF4232)
MKGAAVNSRAGSSGAARLGVSAVAVMFLALASGCASSSSSPSAPSTPSSPSTPAAPSSASTPASAPAPTLTPAVTAPPACATSALQVKQGLAQGYAGGVYEVIDFTNTSSASCTLYGYPGVSLVSGPPYRQIGLAAERDTTNPVTLVTLAPGATANSLLQIVDALNFPPATCSPAKATYLQIYPPNQTAPVYLQNDSEACAKPVQIMFISAVQSGSGGST